MTFASKTDIANILIILQNFNPSLAFLFSPSNAKKGKNLKGVTEIMFHMPTDKVKESNIKVKLKVKVNR